MTTLHHPNIVQFFGYTRCPELALVLEWFPEGSVETYVLSQRPGPKTCLAFCIDMGLAIEYLHSRSPSIVIHRDVKPANFLLTGSHRVKLGDFGIARARRISDANIPLSGSSCSLLDYEGEDFTSNVGTIRYMSPEIAATDGAKTRKYSTKADIFSLALVYYFVWERVAPSIEKHRSPAAHLDGLLSGLRPLFHKMPRLMRDIIEAMWLLEPNDRPDASKVLDYLHRLKCKSFFSAGSLSIEPPKQCRCASGDKLASGVSFPLHRRHTFQ